MFLCDQPPSLEISSSASCLIGGESAPVFFVPTLINCGKYVEDRGHNKYYFFTWQSPRMTPRALAASLTCSISSLLAPMTNLCIDKLDGKPASHSWTNPVDRSCRSMESEEDVASTQMEISSFRSIELNTDLREYFVEVHL